ncbi:MAG: hypothetical protein M3Y09_01815 [Actinomycetota bacterium]|nr:hypothetical protein [Actinomycetota bacterium]
MDAADPDEQLETTARRAALATNALTVGGVTAAIGGALVARWVALLPIAFILGWLNLVGL